MRFERQRIAGLLAALATFGLVLAPVLHAQLHASEAEQERDRALAELFRVAFERSRGPGWSAALEDALEHAFGGEDEASLPEVRHHHDHGPRHHSHGLGPHGAGALEHLALAIDAAPAAPRVAQPGRVPDRPALAPVVQHLAPRYLVPSFSQGPPRD